MSLRCLLGFHRPLLASIIRQDGGFRALCEDCSLPLQRPESGRWTVREPDARQRR